MSTIDVANVGRVGIVGGTSPLGKCLTELLLRQSVQVTASYQNPQLVPEGWWAAPGLTCVQADVNDPSAYSAFADCSVIVWLVHCRRGMAGQQEVDLNVKVFLEWGQFLATSACEKLIFVSSGGSVYGEPEVLPIPESHPRRPRSPYGEAKRRMEDALWAWEERTGKATAVLRPGNIYGPDSITGRSKGIISSFLQSVYTQTPFKLIGEGKAVRDYIHVEDVSRALLCAIGTRQQHAVWNVGTGVGHASSEVIALIHEGVPGAWPPIEAVPARETDVSANILCNDRILSDAGWQAQIDLAAGLAAVLEASMRADDQR